MGVVLNPTLNLLILLRYQVVYHHQQIPVITVRKSLIQTVFQLSAIDLKPLAFDNYHMLKKKKRQVIGLNRKTSVMSSLSIPRFTKV